MIFFSANHILWLEYEQFKEVFMPRGSKSKYTNKQKRQAHHIEKSEMEKGASRKTAERIGWATVNKQDHGGKKDKE